MNWLRITILQLMGQKRRWLGLICGCLLWLLWMIFGFWATLLLVVMAGIGFTIGRIMEEHKSWKDIVEKLISERFME